MQGRWLLPLLPGLFVGTALLADPPLEPQTSEREEIERLEHQLESVTDRQPRLGLLIELMRLAQGNDPAQELAYGTEALALLAVAPNPTLELEINGALCLAAYNQGEFQAASQRCERSVELARQLEDLEAEAGAVNLLGHAFRRLGDHRRALALSNEALTLFTLLGDHRRRAAALNNVGYAYRYLGDLGQATSYHLRALQAFEAIEDRAGIGKSLRNIGTLYKQNGLPGKALAVLESALAIQRQLDNHRELGKVLATLGTVRLTLGQREEGLDNLEEALGFRQQAGDRTGIAIVLSKLGEAHRDNGQLEQAQRYFEQALGIYQETGERRREADTLVMLGTVLRRRGAAQQGLELVSTAVDIATRLEARHNLMQAYRELAETRAALGQEGEAIEAFRLYDRLKDEILNDAAMRSFAEAQVRIKEASERLHGEAQQQDSAADGMTAPERISAPPWFPWTALAAALGLFGIGFWLRGVLGARWQRDAVTADAEKPAIVGATVRHELPAAVSAPSANRDAELAFALADEPPKEAAGDGGRQRDGSPGFDATQSPLAFPGDYVVGSSAPITALYQKMELLLGAEQTVMIEGETGVGKELVARILHRSSPRRSGPFVPVNCAAIPSELLEAEMFGIGKGVATGVSQRQGWFRSAEGGTLFLDEIGEMPMLLQAKLLRAVQEKRVQPVGETEIAVDVWVISATNQDLMASIDQGRFRSDLFYRLAGALLRVPPLRDRGEDLRALVEHFLRQSIEGENGNFRGISRKAFDLLELYSWPGNIRELQNEIRRLGSQAADGQLICSRMLSERIRCALPAAGPSAAAGSAPRDPLEGAEAPTSSIGSLRMWDHVKHLERELILKALASAGQNRREASRLLGISRTTLLRKIREMGIGS